MRQWFEGLVGPDYAGVAVWAAAVLVLAVLLFIFSRIARSYRSGTFVMGGKNRKTRLAVMDATAIDNHRRLVLVRRDDIEHLILIGGPTDVVVEQNIRLIPRATRPAIQMEPDPAAGPLQPSFPAPLAEQRQTPAYPAEAAAARPSQPARMESFASERPIAPTPSPKPRPPAPAAPPIQAAPIPPMRPRPSQPVQAAPPQPAEPPRMFVAPPVAAGPRSEPELTAETGPPMPDRPAPTPAMRVAPAAAPIANGQAGERTVPMRDLRVVEPPAPTVDAPSAEAETVAPAGRPSPDREIDDALLHELEVTLDGDAPKPGRDEPSLEEEMTRLLGDLSGNRR